MKLKQLLFLGAFSLPHLLFAQWSKLSTGTTKDLKTIHFINNDLGFAAGKDGVLIKTSNGGSNWTAINTATTKEIKSIFFIDANNGWLVGKDGLIRKTTDGGTTWATQTSTVHEDFNDVHFINATQGVIVGEKGSVLITGNGGSTWTNKSIVTGGGSGSDDEGADIYKVQMLSTSKVFAAGKEGFFAVSNNGGNTWTAQVSGTSADLEGMHFTSESNGYVCYKAGGVRKTNGSGTFTPVTAATSKDLGSIFFISDSKGWTIGEEGRIQYTENSGNTWSAQNLSTVTADLNDVYFPSEDRGYIAAEDGIILKYIKGTTNPTAIRTADLLSGVSLYPNPAATTFQIKMEPVSANEPVHIIAYDITGKNIASHTFKGGSTFELPCASWANGTYSIHIRVADKTAQFKVVKQ